MAEGCGVGPLCLTPVMLPLCCVSVRALPDMFQDRGRYHYRTGFLNSILLTCDTRYTVAVRAVLDIITCLAAS